MSAIEPPHSWITTFRAISGRLLAAYLFSGVFSGGALAQSQEPTEYEIKAAMFCKFALFTGWPVSAKGDTFNLCLYGQDPFGAAIDVLAQKSIRGRVIRIQRLHQLMEVDHCHVLYASLSKPSQWQQLFAAVRDKPILTITDAPAARNLGSIINLNWVNRKITFDIDFIAARRAGLHLSSKLLRLAHQVHK